MNKKRAAIFTSHVLSDFAHPNAPRLVNIATLLQGSGYEPSLYGVSQKFDANGVLKGFHYEDWNLGVGRKARKERFSNWKAHIDKVLAEIQPDLIVSAVSETQSARIGNYLANYAARVGVPLIVSIVEWFSFVHFSGYGKFDNFRTSKYKNYLLHEYTMRFVNPRRRNLIVISSYLERYYLAKGCSVLTLPTLIDPAEYANARRTREEDGKTRVVYAGSPRRKDCIMNAFKALALLSDAERARLEFHIFGAEERELKSLGLSQELPEKIKSSLKLHGRIPYAEVKQQVANADFTILLRENKRNANAGFSTKVGESMACGTPVIANLTSDLNRCVLEGKTGLICRDESPESCADAFRRALALDRTSLDVMRANCKTKTAEYFSVNAYFDATRDFLENKLQTFSKGK